MPVNSESRAPFLTGTLPNGKIGKWLLDKDCIVIGREAPADIVLPFPTISRRHACITRTLSGWFVADLGSRNGTFVGRKLVGSEPVLLSNGDEIVLGGAMTFRITIPAQAAADERARGIFMDETTREVWVDGKPLRPALSEAQRALLLLLYHSPGQVCSREQIVAAAWPAEDPQSVSKTAVDGLIKRLRYRLRELQPGQRYIQVLRGKGVRLVQSGR